jgi:hypothetical protein
MTVPSTPDTGMRASMTVPSSPATGMWACMMVTSTMTPVLWSINRTQPLPHACRRHHQQHMHGQQLPRHCPAADQHDHHNHLVVHPGSELVQETGQVPSKVQNACKIQVMLDNLTKYMLLHFCSGNFITVANGKLLSKARCETQPFQVQAMLVALSTITVITSCWAFIKLDNINTLSMYLYNPQPNTPTTTAATPTAACWPPSPPTTWSGTPGPWSQVGKLHTLKWKNSNKGERMPSSIRVALFII